MELIDTLKANGGEIWVPEESENAFLEETFGIRFFRVTIIILMIATAPILIALGVMSNHHSKEGFTWASEMPYVGNPNVWAIILGTTLILSLLRCLFEGTYYMESLTDWVEFDWDGIFWMFLRWFLISSVAVSLLAGITVFTPQTQNEEEAIIVDVNTGETYIAETSSYDITNPSKERKREVAFRNQKTGKIEVFISELSVTVKDGMRTITNTFERKDDQ